MLASHSHLLKRQDCPGRKCDVAGAQCSKTSTQWRCFAGCDFGICTACWEERVHGIEVAGGQAGKAPDGSWVAYEQAAVGKCRAALLEGKTRLMLVINATEYRVDFGNMTQRRAVDSRVERAIRFVAMPGLAKSKISPADTHGIEEWEYEDGLPGSGDWKPVEKTMASELSRLFQAGRATFPISIHRTGKAPINYDVDLLRMEQKRVDTSVVRGLRMSAEVHVISSLCNLAPCQRKALEHITAKAKASHESSLPKLFERCDKIGFPKEKVAAALVYFRNTVQIVIHVKKEHLVDKKKLAGDTHYRNQFETGTSGGAKCLKTRKMWEKALFAGAYDECESFYRPKYGVANVVNDRRGIKAARQYGECFLELSAAARRRCTFSGKDSGGIEDSKLATCQYYAHVMLNDYSDQELASIIMVANQTPSFLASDCIEKYKEVQIHGPVELKSDIVALHVPETEDCAELRSLATKHSFGYCKFNPAPLGIGVTKVK